MIPAIGFLLDSVIPPDCMLLDLQRFALLLFRDVICPLE